MEASQGAHPEVDILYTPHLDLRLQFFASHPTLPQGQVVARPMMYLALTYDHRLIDGREAVTFLKSVAMKVEDPQRLLLGL